MRTAGDIVRAALDELEPDERRALSGVVLRVALEPGPEDIARGCGADWRGYFYGSAPARADGSRHELPESDTPAPATGSIGIFLGNIKPLTPERLRLVVRHELAHALGYTEEEIVLEQGLAFEEELAPELLGDAA